MGNIKIHTDLQRFIWWNPIDGKINVIESQWQKWSAKRKKEKSLKRQTESKHQMIYI